MKKYTLLLSFILLILVTGCDKSVTPDVDPIPDPVELEVSSEVALKWVDMTLKVMKESPSNSPTYASRTLGYIGITMYESVVNGSIIYNSVAGLLSGLAPLVKPEGDLDWETTLSAGQAAIIKHMYPHASDKLKEDIDFLHNSIKTDRVIAGISADQISKSEEYGVAIANIIYEWSKEDKGHEGYKNVFDANYEYPSGRQYWSPPAQGQSSIMLPMHPYWGNNRLFVPKNDIIPIPEILEYSTDKESDYYKEMQLVYEVNTNLTQEEKETALWWGDDPAVSPSPPGHSYFLAAKLVAQNKTNLFEATSAFAKVGMAVADAFVCTWKCKYHYHAERPTNFIKRNIDGRYSQFWPEPPFPAFTSGHSTQAAAAATALISVFGDANHIVDDFHTGRPKDIVRNVEFKTREFDSIWAFAEECGYSRILGGIHTPQDNERGLEEGKLIGENVNALLWTK